MKKLFYIFITLSFFIALLVWLMPSQKAEQAKIENSLLKKHTNRSRFPSQKTSLTLTDSEIQERIQESNTRRKFIKLDENKLHKGILEKEMFHSSDAETVAKFNPMELTEEQKNDGRIFLSNDLYTLEGKKVGDSIELNVPEYGLKREATITKIDVDPKDDIVSWSGYLVGGDTNKEGFHITQTVKDNFTIGTINSDDKTYSMLIKNGYGWINDVANESAAILAGESDHDH
ncbi:metalloprotease secretion chaperone CpaB [Acinetobacter pittii]|uniref:metalloprotease secretion chaperone CpaB n=1 Tax=Acinetobacter pittii TaxID=48296 RepID=UPI001EFE6CF4|nr:metalloprotease secretion chaperone CpaB [Acinetobacter pittii]MCG9494184.1 metalloprotease secretion chaperone CpaB [Acinetobacter pittii]